MLRIVLVSLALVVLIACGRELQTEEKTHLSVVQAANGNLYSTKCLRDADTDQVSDCRVDVDADDARGFHGGKRKAFDFSSMLIWDLQGFDPFAVCDFFKNPFLDLNQCSGFFGFPVMPSLPKPKPPIYRPQCQVDWFASLYFPQFNQYGCGFTWRPYPHGPKPIPVTSDLLRVKIKGQEADGVTYYRLEGVPTGSTPVAFGYHRFTKVFCQNGYCKNKTLGYIGETEFVGLLDKANKAKAGTISDVAPPEIQCLAYSPERRYTANDGATILSVQQDCGGETKKNSAPEAQQLVDWLKAKISSTDPGTI